VVLGPDHPGASGTPGIPREEFDRRFDELSNWSRWGSADERGTLNHLAPDHVVAAARLVRTGRHVSLARTLDPVASERNPRPFLHHMVQLADAGTGDARSNRDFFGLDFHGSATTHLDALAHMTYRGQLYNGQEASTVTSRGAGFGAVSVLRDGIVTRGVLLDLPPARGVPWVEPPVGLTADDVADLADGSGVEIGAGDAVVIRSGEPARPRADGRHGTVGLRPDALAWLAERRIALLGSDEDSDARPSPVEGIPSPIHVLALVSLGMCLLDNLDLEALSRACREQGRSEFLLVVAPLVAAGGTGSPVNPIAIF